MKTKRKQISEYQKAEIRMKQEKCRALAQVKFLENIYKEMKQKEKK